MAKIFVTYESETQREQASLGKFWAELGGRLYQNYFAHQTSCPIDFSGQILINFNQSCPENRLGKLAQLECVCKLWLGNFWATFGQVLPRPISTVLGKSLGVSAALGWN